MPSRTIAISGAFGVLGRAVSETFIARGDAVARIDFAPAASGEKIEGCVDFGGVDLSVPAEAEKVCAAITTELGPIDTLINIAGGFIWETMSGSAGDNWSRMFALNLMTCLNMTKAALPGLQTREQGRIINIGAMGALQASAGMGPYAASKAAVHKLTESLAAELAGGTCTVNAVLPSIIDTPTNRADMPDADHSQWVSPAAIADVIAFLASPGARAISGALIPVTRGTR